MNISELFIRKPVMTTLSSVALVAFGIVAYFQLPISDLPTVDYPVMTISVAYPGASPAMMASAVASPIEQECMQIPGLVSVISDNTEGQTLITLTFELDRTADLVAPDVQAAITRATANLPTDLPAPPTYSKNNPSDKPILYLCLRSATMPPADMYDYAHRAIGQRISMIEGVSKVDVYGSKRAVRVQLDPQKLAACQLGLDEICRAIQSGTVTIPGGSLNGPFRTFSIEPHGQLFRAADYEQLIVAYRNNAPVRLGDLGRCIDSTENDLTDSVFGQQGGALHHHAVCIAISRQAGANTVALASRIRAALGAVRAELPGALELSILYDRSEKIVESITDVKTTIVIALVLVMAVIFLFLGRVRDTIIPSVAMPFSILGTFICMKALGFSLDNLSLMGLTLCVGFLVDDAIVELENTVRHVEKGVAPFEAAIISAKEISGTVISTSVALMIVFVPLVFMQGVVGRNFYEFAMTVVAAIFCSLVSARTLTPMMLSRMLSAAQEQKTRLQTVIDTIVGAMINGYGVLLRWVLQHKIASVLAWLVCIAGSVWLLARLPKSFLPEGDSGLINGQLVMQQGTSTDQIRAFQAALNQILLDDPNVNEFFTFSGISPGADQSTAPFYISLKSPQQRKPIQAVVQELNRKLAALPYRFAFMQAVPFLQISTGGESTATGSKYSFLISGADRETVYACAQQLEQTMHTLPGFRDIQSSVKLAMPQLDVRIHRDRASTLGINAKDISTALQLAFAGGKITTFKTDVDQYDVIMELLKHYQHDPEQLAAIYVRSPLTGELVPLGALASWQAVTGPQNVPHYDQLNAATLSFNIDPSVPLSAATAALNAAARRILPPGIAGRFQGEAQEFQEAVRSLSVLLLVAVFLMYITLGILYESYVHPFTVLTTLPVAAFGGLLTLLIFGAELSLYAYIGMFMLLGIVAKNGIMMVDFAQQYLNETNSSDFDAIYHACLIRFRPILMTGLAAIFGALPIALGYGADGASRIPLGLVVVGGLIFAQVITLFVTPGIFLYMQQLQRRLRL